ncbi:MAG TPA: MerR family transcriptional regulator [Candidatus Limiplasma sp.]|nr:MerR family transcriptional regulator [Candidatus Limiplasma sp.]
MELKIGEFAAFCDISVRALRLYDQMGLVKPLRIDPATGYRYYDPEQLQTVNAILSYKKIGFSLQEIRLLLSPRATSALLIRKLREKLKQNESKADIYRYYNENIQNILNAFQASAAPDSEQEAALRLSRIACLENDSLQEEFSRILWL